MKRFHRVFAMAGLMAGLVLSSAQLSAQGQGNGPGGQGGAGGGGGQGGPGGPGGRGNFDPAQMRQRMMDRYKEQLEITDDAEWKIIQDRVEKVMAAQRDARGGAFGMFGGRGGRGGGQGGGQGGPGGGGRGGFGGEPSPEAEALQKAIEGKASADELKTKLAKYRDSRKESEAKLEKAQDDLRKVLNARQEAVAVLAGLLK